MVKAICKKTYPDENDILAYVHEGLPVENIRVYIKGEIHEVGEKANPEYWEIIKNEYPYEEGDIYWVKEGADLVESVWDEQSEEMHDKIPNRKYFDNLESGLFYMKRQGYGTVRPITIYPILGLLLRVKFQ